MKEAGLCAGYLEEHLNVHGYFAQEKEKRGNPQIDLLIPAKEKI